jgi:hypothetical protein
MEAKVSANGRAGPGPHASRQAGAVPLAGVDDPLSWCRNPPSSAVSRLVSGAGAVDGSGIEAVTVLNTERVEGYGAPARDFGGWFRGTGQRGAEGRETSRSSGFRVRSGAAVFRAPDGGAGSAGKRVMRRGPGWPARAGSRREAAGAGERAGRLWEPRGAPREAG